jgi:hypothetical protein
LRTTLQGRDGTRRSCGRWTRMMDNVSKHSVCRRSVARYIIRDIRQYWKVYKSSSRINRQ